MRPASKQTDHPGQGQPSTQDLLTVIREIAADLRPQDADRLQVTLDSSLDRDLGLDSLARVELLTRIERKFALSLPEHALADAETVRDVLHALRAGRVRAAAPPGVAVPETTAPGEGGAPEAGPAPESTQTLLEVLEWHVQAHPERVHVHLYGDSGELEPVTYGALLAGAQRVAGGLLARGLDHGDCVAIMLPTGVEYFHAFLGVLLAGGVPVPIYPPARPSQIEEHVRQHAGVLSNARAKRMITFDQVRPVARLLRSQVPDMRGLETVSELAAGERAETMPAAARAEDVAFIQYTSGSTGRPKGVVLTHRDILANLRAMGRALDVRPTDVFVSWLPLYHDMGLIGAWMGCLYYALPLVLMSPLRFLSRPAHWLWAIHAHRGTLSGGPNFAYELCLRRIEDAEIEGLDLSAWRLAFNGAEPVSPATLHRFAERFARYGFAREAFAPVYGLAEATLGVAFTPVDRGARVDRVSRSLLAREARAVPIGEAGTDEVLEVVSCGVPLPGYEVRVVDTAGRELPERMEGELEFRGPSTTSGYYRNPEATQELFRHRGHDGWLDSGDRAYVAEGEVYLTSRSKDVIIRSGRNIYPYELERAVGELDGIRRGCVAVFGSRGPEAHTERLVVVAETREQAPEVRAKLRARIDDLAVGLLGTPPDEVVLAPPYTVPKTSSGKIRRPVLRSLYEKEELRVHRRAPWLQFVRLAFAGIAPQLRHWGRSARASAHALYVWSLFALYTPVVWSAVVLLPRLTWRWAFTAAAGRSLLRLAGVRLAVNGTANLPSAGPYVLVSNHASYLDGLVLIAALPRPVGFVAKRELSGNVFSRLFLERLGARFVERFDRQRGVEDARRVAQALGEGTALGFFAEGTFKRMPGLLPFHLGAFVAAAEADVPVVPVTLRGTRSVLRGDELFPRRGTVRVEVSPPISTAGAGAGSEPSGWERAIRLRDRVRAEILARCGEPDLARNG